MDIYPVVFVYYVAMSIFPQNLADFLNEFISD